MKPLTSLFSLLCRPARPWLAALLLGLVLAGLALAQEPQAQAGTAALAPPGATLDAPPAGLQDEKSLGEVLRSLLDGQTKAEVFEGLPLYVMLVVAFLIGLALNLTPCVYPVIPITISYFGGRAGSSRLGLLANVGAYWLGMASTYTALGAMAALSGRMLGEWLALPWVVGGLALIFLLLASSMFGLWEIRLPASLSRLGAANRGGLPGAFLMGLTVGIMAAPCIGPVVLGLMAQVASVGRVFYGVAVFLLLSLGLGLPLSVLAFFSGSLNRLPRSGEWMIWVRKLFGVVLVLMAINVARPLTGEGALPWLMATTLALGGIYLGFYEKSGKGAFLKVKYLAGVLLVLAAPLAYLYLQATPQPQGRLEWVPYTPAVLSQAAQEGKPVLVDFTASWCVPCRQMEAETFPVPAVQQALGHFKLLKVDLSTEPSPDAKRLIAQWRVRGVPTMIFLDKKGKVISELTIVGFLDASDFRDRVVMALARSDAER